jgi:hypothetical protein
MCCGVRIIAAVASLRIARAAQLDAVLSVSMIETLPMRPLVCIDAAGW